MLERTRRVALGVALLLAGTAAQGAPACRAVVHDGAGYTVCTAHADRADIRVWHSDTTGRLFGAFRAVEAALRAHGARLAFAMNAGMYHEDRRPLGLYVEDGVERAPLVTAAGPGNFGLLPNGVFCLRAGSAAVIETRAFAAAGETCRYATQSGPMLVIAGALHPRFLPDSTSRHVRNGVGVAADGVTVHFAISDAPVTFDAFGRLFRDGLGTPNALYLDGNVSRLYAPEIGRADIGFAPLGPIVGVAVPVE